jgi:hypothetical protein
MGHSMMIDGHRPRIAAAALIVALGGVVTAEAAPRVVKLADTQLDPTALFFVSFDGLVNNASYRAPHDPNAFWHMRQ